MAIAITANNITNKYLFPKFLNFSKHIEINSLKISGKTPIKNAVTKFEKIKPIKI